MWKDYINYVLMNGKLLKMMTIHIQMTKITWKGLFLWLIPLRINYVEEKYKIRFSVIGLYQIFKKATSNLQVYIQYIIIWIFDI